jgi:exonuclease III
MRVCFWNIRGLGGKGRRRQLREMIFKQRIDMICLQETMKTHFSLANLRNLVGGRGSLGIGPLQGGILGGL